MHRENNEDPLNTALHTTQGCSKHQCVVTLLTQTRGVGKEGRGIMGGFSSMEGEYLGNLNIAPLSGPC